MEDYKKIREAKLQAVLGYLAIVLSQFFVKQMSKSLIPIHFALTFRGIFNLCLNLKMGAYSKIKQSLVLQSLEQILVLRSLMASVIALFYFGVLQYLEITIVNAIWMLSPVLTHFTEKVVFGTPVETKTFALTLLGFLGVLVFLNPISVAKLKLQRNYVLSCWLLVLVAAVNAYSMTILKWFTELQTLISLHYFYLCNIVCSVISLHTFSNEFSYQFFSFKNLLFMVLFCVFAYLGQSNIQSGIMKSNAKTVMSFSYLMIAVGFLMDRFLFGEQFSVQKIAGVAMIAVSSALNLIKI